VSCIRVSWKDESLSIPFLVRFVPALNQEPVADFLSLCVVLLLLTDKCSGGILRKARADLLDNIFSSSYQTLLLNISVGN
jgi:hypothetical protein